MRNAIRMGNFLLISRMFVPTPCAIPIKTAGHVNTAIRGVAKSQVQAVRTQLGTAIRKAAADNYGGNAVYNRRRENPYFF